MGEAYMKVGTMVTWHVDPPLRGRITAIELDDDMTPFVTLTFPKGGHKDVEVEADDVTPV